MIASSLSMYNSATDTLSTIRLVIQSHFFQTWEAGVVMDADNVIQLVQCLSNRTRPVYTFAIGYLGQDRGQRS